MAGKNNVMIAIIWHEMVVVHYVSSKYLVVLSLQVLVHDTLGLQVLYHDLHYHLEYKLKVLILEMVIRLFSILIHHNEYRI